MIHNGYALSVQDISKLQEFKKSAAYGMYLKSISNSPAFKIIMNEHVNNIDISEDVKKLKTEGKLPDSVSAKALSDLFKQSVARTAICITADSVILKELENIKIDEVLSGLQEEGNITYLLGKADKKYYEQASRMLEQGKLDQGSLAYKGLLVYLKQGGETKMDLSDVDTMIEHKVEKVKKKAESKEINFDSSSIDL
jgi:hypothetical protein